MTAWSARRLLGVLALSLPAILPVGSMSAEAQRPSAEPASALPQPFLPPRTIPQRDLEPLQESWQKLENRHVALAAEIAANNAKCDPEHDEATERACVRERDELAVKYQRYVTDLKTHVDACIAVLRRQTEGYARAINAFNFAKRAEDIEDWADLAKDAQQHFEDETRRALVDAAFAAAKKGLQVGVRKTYGSLSTFRGNQLVAQLRRLGLEDKWLFDKIHKVSHHSGKPGEAEAIGHMITDAYRVWKGFDAGTKSAKGEQSEAIIKLLGAALADHPQYAALAHLSRFSIAALYRSAAQWLSVYEIEWATTLTERQLEQMKDLTVKMEAAGKDLQTAKKHRAVLVKLGAR